MNDLEKRLVLAQMRRDAVLADLALMDGVIRSGLRRAIGAVLLARAPATQEVLREVGKKLGKSKRARLESHLHDRPADHENAA